MSSRTPHTPASVKATAERFGGLITFVYMWEGTGRADNQPRIITALGATETI